MLWRPAEIDTSADVFLNNHEIAGVVDGFAAAFTIFAFLDIFNIYSPNPALFMTLLFTTISLVLANTLSSLTNRYTTVSRSYMTGIGTALLTVTGAVGYIEFGFQREIRILTLIILALYAGYANIHYVGRSWTTISAYYFYVIMLLFGIVVEMYVLLASANSYFSSSGRIIFAYVVLMSTYGFSNSSWKYARPFWIASLAVLTFYVVTFLALLLSLLSGTV